MPVEKISIEAPELASFKAMLEKSNGIKINEFAYTNKAGGTALSSYASFLGSISGLAGMKEYTGLAEANIVGGFWDYELGYRFIAKPINEELASFVKENGDDEMLIYFSEFDVDAADADKLNNAKLCIDAIADEGYLWAGGGFLPKKQTKQPTPF